jgi:outer membrane lipoprotein-sorting protein
MRKTLTATTLLLLAVFAAASPVTAESTAEAKQWLEKLASSYEKRAFSFGYDASMQIAQMGQTASMTMTGDMSQQDREHLRMNLSMEIAMPGAEGGMQIEVLSVADGEFMWLEMKNPMMGGRQVLKLPLDKLEELAATNPMAASAVNMDPVGQIEQLSKIFDFEVGETGDKTVTLQAKITEESLQQLAPGLPPEQATMYEKLVLVLDKESAFPAEVSIGGEQPLLVMNFHNLKFHDAFEDGTFSYTPPEGVPVTDLGATAEGMQQAAPSEGP